MTTSDTAISPEPSGIRACALVALSDLIHGRPQLATRLGSRCSDFDRELTALLERLPTDDDDDEWDWVLPAVERFADSYGLRVGHEPLPIARGVDNGAAVGSVHRRNGDLFRLPAASVEIHGLEELRSNARVFINPVVPPDPRRIVTFPEAYAPDTVVLGDVFEVHVGLSAESSSGEGPQMVLLPAEDEQVEVEVEVVLSEDGRVESDGAPLRGRLLVGDSGQSPSLGFSLVARAEGPTQVEVVFRYGAIERLRLSVPVYVAKVGIEAPEPGSRVATGSMVFAAVADPVVILRVTPLGPADAPHALRFRLLPPADLRRHECTATQSISGDTQSLLVELCRSFDREFSDGAWPATHERRLRNTAAKATKALVPAEIQSALGKLGEATVLHIESPDAWVPWEMLWIGGMRRGFFLGERFALTRWLYEGSRRDRITVGHAVAVTPTTDPPLEAKPELAAIERLSGGTPTRLRTLDEVSALLDGRRKTDPPMRFLHFVAHGGLRHDDPLAGRIVLEHGRSLTTSDVPLPHPDDRDEDTPLLGCSVFVNACQTGISGQPSLTGHGSWATAFARAGVAAFIAPSWSVYDDIASAFAVALYDHIANGVTFGEAARRARIAARREGSPDRLAFAVFALPGLRLVEEGQ